MRWAPLPFTLRQLQYALAIAETGSFRRAAALCRVAQPSLSAQLAELERSLRRADLRVRPFAEPVPSRQLVLAMRKSSPLGPALREVAHVLARAVAVANEE